MMFNVSELEGIKQLSEVLYKGGLTPKGVNKPELIAVRIIAGLEVGLSPVQAVNNIMVVNGRASIWGDAALALVCRSGKVALTEQIDGEGDERQAVCHITREGRQSTTTFSVADAKRAGLWGKEGPWQTYPDRMLTMRARSWGLRDTCADILCGLSLVEEQQDITPKGGNQTPETVTPTPAAAPTQETVTPASPPDANALVSEATLSRIAHARPTYLRSQGVDTDDAEAVQAAWTAIRIGLGVSSARSLTEVQAKRLLAGMEAKSNIQEVIEIFGHAGPTR